MSASTTATKAPNTPRGFLLLRGIIIPIPLDRKFIIGRDKQSCDIAFPDQRVSKQHILIRYREQKYTITDMDSMNGIYLNGEKVVDTFPLRPGDEIKVAPFSMLFIGPDQVQVQGEGLGEGEQGTFSGQLETLNVVDLIQLINSTGQSGLLNLRDSKNKIATTTFIRGEIVTSSYGVLRQEEAVYAVLAMNEGDFDFVRGEQTMPLDPIENKTQTLLLQGCQLKDENRVPSMAEEVREPSRMSTQPISVPADLSH